MPASMSREDDVAFSQILAKDPECLRCFECGTAKPQWCDVLHGLFICLECSGLYRSLGVHLAFVRSSTMDSWTDWSLEKLRRMQLGGNRRARLYFEENGIAKLTAKERYMTLEALRYAAMLESESTGVPFNASTWQPPDWFSRVKATPDVLSGAPAAPQQHNDIYHSGGQRTNGSGNNWFSALSTGLSTMAAKTSQFTSEALQNRDIDSIKGSLSRGWNSVSSTVSTYAQYIQDEAQQSFGESDGNQYQPVGSSRDDDDRQDEPQHSDSIIRGRTVRVHDANSPSVANGPVLTGHVVQPNSSTGSMGGEWSW